MPQIPHGHEHLDCPFWHKKMSEVCHKCPMWVQIRGVDPQTGEIIGDEWQCTLTWLPKLMLDNTQQSRQAGAAIESFRNEMVKLNKVSLALQQRNGHSLIEKA